LREAEEAPLDRQVRIGFIHLLSLSYDQRNEPKDVHDLVYCLEHYEGGLGAAQEAFRAASPLASPTPRQTKPICVTGRSPSRCSRPTR
jgi:hypothetical protein